MSVIVPQGLVGYWPLDLGDMNWGANLTFDRSGKGNNGALVNLTSAALRTGIVRQALLFNGTTQYIDIAGPTIAAAGAAFTYIAWISNLTSSATDLWILTEGRTFSSTPIVGIIAEGGKGRFAWRADTGSPVSVVGSTTINNSKNHLICGVSDGTKMFLYVDGRLDATPATSPAGTITLNTRSIGALRRGTVGQWFPGIIDEARFYSRALGAEEILRIYTAGTSGRAWNSRSSRTAIMAGQTTAKTLAAGSGSYALSGTVAATPKQTRRTIAAASSYALTGANTTLRKSAIMVAASGSYAVTGTTAALKRDEKLAADSGIYALAGTDAALLKGARSAAAIGSYSITGADAGLTHAGPGNFSLAAGAGAYALTGTNAALEAGFRVAATTGGFVLTGADASLRHGRQIIAGEGINSLVGIDAALLLSAFRLDAEMGSFNFSGADAAIIAGSARQTTAHPRAPSSPARARSGHAAAVARAANMPARPRT